MSDIAIIVGRKILSNINRELILLKHLKKFNLNPYFLIPGPNISQISLDDEDIKKFKNANIIKFNDLEHFKKITKDFNKFLIASWRDYFPLVSILKKNNKKIIVYSDAGGIDYWDLGCKQLLIKSQANIDLFCNARRNLLINFFRKSFLNFKITGSLRYEYVDDFKPKDIKDKKKLLVFFPKSISKLKIAIKHWFPKKNEEWYLDYIKLIEENYINLGQKIKKLGYKFLVKTHYASEDKFFSNDNNYDKIFWQSNGFEVYEGDERNIFNQLDIGLGYETHSAIDVNLHKKPFIYLIPKINMRPQVRGFCLEKFLNKNKKNCFGYSEKFNIKKSFLNYLWLPYWYGSTCTIENIEACMDDIFSTPLNENLCNNISEYYWGHQSDIRPSEKIIREFIKN